jgi:phosphopantothenoylcysteine synthetase/decarboxylase
MIASCASAIQLDSDQISGNSVHKRPRVLLAVTGSVAAIKGPELAIRIAEEFHADVKILLTRGGQNFWDKAEAYNPHYWRKMQEMLLDGKNNDSIAAIHCKRY